MSNKIKHAGVVDGVEGECVRVRILQSSACSACKVAAHCNASETKEKNKIKKIITDLDGKNYRWYQSYDENLGEDLYLLIVKWFNKKRAWSSYDFSFLISKFIKL